MIIEYAVPNVINTGPQERGQTITADTFGVRESPFISMINTVAVSSASYVLLPKKQLGFENSCHV